jgi:DNA-binding CsgD family transcriptional regulator
MQPGGAFRAAADQGEADMLDLLDTLTAPAPRPLPGPYPVGADAARAARNYADPERRGAASMQARRLAQMLDTLDYGMLLISDTLAVGHVNKAARRDLDECHPLQLVGGQLQARFAADAQVLREALLAATQRGLRRLLQLGDARHRVSLAVVPLPALGADEPAGAALLLGKRQVCEELTVDWFARSHGLTMAETAVIKGLCADLTPQQIAERQGVGLATIRTQIGSIRLKTGAGSIRALVQQVALLPPLVSALQTLPTTLAPGGTRVLHS